MTVMPTHATHILVNGAAVDSHTSLVSDISLPKVTGARFITGRLASRGKLEPYSSVQGNIVLRWLSIFRFISRDKLTPRAVAL